MKKWLSVLLVLLLTVSTALAMTEDEAKKLILMADPSAKDARRMSVHPNAAGDGAFVAVARKWGKRTSEVCDFWYVNREEAFNLGHSNAAWSWVLIPSTPEVFCATIGEDQHARACALIDGVPVDVIGAEKVFALINTGSDAIAGLVEKNSGCNAFFRLDGTQLVQIAAKEITREELLGWNGAEEVLKTVEGAGWKIEQILYWEDSAVALNFTQDGREMHTYVYRIDGKLQLTGGWWGDDIGLFGGYAVPVQEVDLPVYETK